MTPEWETTNTKEDPNNRPILKAIGGSRKRLAATSAAAAIALALTLGACSDDTEPVGSAGEAAESAEGSGHGEAAEAGHAGEAGQGEAAEGGNVTLLTPTEIYDENVNGARLQLSFDSANNAFVGTVENTTNQTLTRARVEVHLSSGTELGPTTPTDLGPGEVIDLTLPSTAEAFDTWSAHAEVGAAESGDGGEGAEGANHNESGEGANHNEDAKGANHNEDAKGANHNEDAKGAGSEGAEGASEGSAAAPGTTTHLTSAGVSRGIHATQALAVDDSYAGKLNDLELAITYDATKDQFVGRVRNEANEGFCNTSINVTVDGQAGGQSVLIPSLDLRGRADFTLDAPTNPFTQWQAEAETFSCTTVVSDAGEGGEGSGTEGGNESSGEGAGHEGSGSEGGADAGEEISLSTPVDQPATGNFNNLDYNIAFDPTTQAFVGTVTNNTNQTVCASRLEVHMAANGTIIELGPTVGVDLNPGQTLNMVLSADPITPDTYSLHPESSPCIGQTASDGSEAGASEANEGASHEDGNEGGGG